jgi:hypothetical protein
MSTWLDKQVNKLKKDPFVKDVVQQVKTNLLGSTQPYLGGSLGPTEANPFDADPLIDFSKSNTSYSGSDCTVIAQLNNKLIVLGNLETISHSIHREKSAVRVLGRSHAKGYTAGPRTIAGSMIFIVFDRAPLYDVIKELNYIKNPSDRTTSPLPDQLPPIDLILLFQNEYGHRSITRLYGVEFLDEGQVHSINDLYSECTMQYVAKDMDQMIAYKDIAEFKDMMFERQVKGLFIDNQFSALMDYQKKVQQDITDCETIIAEIDKETNKRAVAGAFTFYASEWLNRLANGKDYVSREDLKREKDKQLKILTGLYKELESINNQIEIKQRTLTGWNAQGSLDNGVATSVNDYISHAVNTPIGTTTREW